MRRISQMAALTAAALTSITLVPAAASARSTPSPDVRVSISPTASTLSTTRVRHSGVVSFRVTTGKGAPANGTESFTVFQLGRHGTPAQVRSWVRAVESQSTPPKTAARLMRVIKAHAFVDGGAQTMPGVTVTAVLFLRPGTYWTMGGDSLALHRLIVSGPARYALPRISATVTMVKGNRFSSPARLPRNGFVLVRNRSSELHFLELQRVKPGTTDAQLTKLFHALVTGKNPGPVPFRNPVFGSDVLSPGHQQLIGYNVHSGAFAELCFVPDDVTGMPHAFMGMHKVVSLH